MARRDGYGKSEPVEWFKIPIQTYGEAIVSAGNMEQEVGTWLIDAVNHHLYRCDALNAQERYQLDEAVAAESHRPTPDKNDSRYAVARPTITRSRSQGSASNAPYAAPGTR